MSYSNSPINPFNPVNPGSKKKPPFREAGLDFLNFLLKHHAPPPCEEDIIMTATIIIVVTIVMTLFSLLFNTKWDYIAKIAPPDDITKNYSGFFVSK